MLTEYQYIDYQDALAYYTHSQPNISLAFYPSLADAQRDRRNGYQKVSAQFYKPNPIKLSLPHIRSLFHQAEKNFI